MRNNYFRGAFLAIGLVFVGIVGFLPIHASAQEAMAGSDYYSYKGLLLDTSGEGTPLYCYDRIKNAKRFKWNGHAWVLVNAGNDLLLYDLEDPGRGLLDRGGYGFGYNCAVSEPPVATITGPVTDGSTGAGDGVVSESSPESYSAVDYLDSYSVCDSYSFERCRFAVANWYHGDSGALLIDLGPSTGDRPLLKDYWKYPTSPSGSRILFGATWGWNNNQFLVAEGMASGAGCTDGRAIYTVNPGNPPVLTFEECAPAGFAPRYSKQVNDLLFFYDGTKVHVWGLDVNSGLPLPNEASGSPVAAFGDSAVAVDGRRYRDNIGPVIMVVTDPTAAGGTAKMFEISRSGDSVISTHVYTFPEPNNFNPPDTLGWYAAAVNLGPTGDFVFLLQQTTGVIARKLLYDISNTTNPLVIDGGYDGYWNDSDADFNTDGDKPSSNFEYTPVFSYDGFNFLLVRKYQLPRFEFGTPIPMAGLEVQPQVRYPGDTITIVDRSSSATGSALWITQGDGTPIPGLTQFVPPSYDLDPPTDDVVWDTSSLQPMAFDDACGVLPPGPYTAHNEILPAGDGDRVDKVIAFQCKPGVAIIVTPATAMTGEVVTLTGTVDGGTPIQWEWKVTDPANTTIPTTHPGNGTGTDSLDVSITQAGEWKFELTAVYQHTVGGGAWEAVAPAIVKSYSSVAPVLRVDPENPGPADTVTLIGSDSLLGHGLEVDWTYSLNGTVRCSGHINDSDTEAVPNCEIGTLTVSSDPYVAVLELEPNDGSGKISDTKSFSVTDIDFIISNTTPKRGETVSFQKVNIPSSKVGIWDFGGYGCDGVYGRVECDGDVWCGSQTQLFKYKDEGEKTVTLETTDGRIVTKYLTVQDEGECDSEVRCDYSISPGYFTVPSSGGTYTLRINTTAATCGWSAASLNPSWITVSPTSGSGTKALEVRISRNGGGERQGSIRVIADKAYTVDVYQSAGVVCDPISATFTWTPDRDTIAVGETVHFVDTSNGVSTRRWRVYLEGSPLPESSVDKDFFWKPTVPGRFDVELVVSNSCGATGSKRVSFSVTDMGPIDMLIVTGAAHAPGLEGTVWRTDVNLFNPTDDLLQVELQLLPYGQDNTDPQFVKPYPIQSFHTLKVQDVVKELWPEVGKGGASVRIKPAGSTVPSVVARTYNQTPAGTYGSFIPMFSRPVISGDTPVLGGLRADSAYRTNVLVTNHTDEAIGNVAIEIYNASGTLVETTDARQLDPFSTQQFVKVGDGLGLELFSIRVTAPADKVSVSASVVENVSGDSVLVVPTSATESILYLPGLAHLPGKNETYWRSDLTFTNPGKNAKEVRFTLHLWRVMTRSPYEEEDVAVGPITLQAGESRKFEDVLGNSWEYWESELDSVAGYSWIEVEAGSAAPLVQAQTYTTVEEGGAYGQGVAVFGGDQVLKKGEAGFVAGVSNSSDGATGFRSNVGLLCTGTSNCVVGMRLYRSDGIVLAERSDVVVAPMEYIQSTITGLLPDLKDRDVFGSLEVSVLDGGPLVAFVSIVDNATGDGIFVPVTKIDN